MEFGAYQFHKKKLKIRKNRAFVFIKLRIRRVSISVRLSPSVHPASIQSIPGQAVGVPESPHFPFVQDFQESFINYVAAVGVFQPDHLSPVLRINNPQSVNSQPAKAFQFAAQRLDVAASSFQSTHRGAHTFFGFRRQRNQPALHLVRGQNFHRPNSIPCKPAGPSSPPAKSPPPWDCSTIPSFPAAHRNPPAAWPHKPVCPAGKLRTAAPSGRGRANSPAPRKLYM